MTTTYFKRAPTRRQAITECRTEGSIVSIESISPRVFSVKCEEYTLLAVVTDLVVGKGDANIFKVEIGLYPE